MDQIGTKEIVVDEKEITPQQVQHVTFKQVWFVLQGIKGQVWGRWKSPRCWNIIFRVPAEGTTAKSIYRRFTLYAPTVDLEVLCLFCQNWNLQFFYVWWTNRIIEWNKNQRMAQYLFILVSLKKYHLQVSWARRCDRSFDVVEKHLRKDNIKYLAVVLQLEKNNYILVS